jgi:hypothetical protein
MHAVEATPAGILSAHYDVLRDGGRIAAFRFADRGGRAEFEAGGRRCAAFRLQPARGTIRQVLREVFVRIEYVLEVDGVVAVRAARAGLIRNGFDVEDSAGGRWRLQPMALRRRGYVLRDADGEPAGRLEGRGALRRGFVGELAAALPAEVQFFVLYLLVSTYESVHSG